jgi:dCMP deaminase
MFITHSPCRQCSKAIINGRISKVIYDIQYRDTTGIEILKASGISVFSLKEAENITL